MSATKVDFAKVSQLFDAGWSVRLSKNTLLKSYSAVARNIAGRTVRTDDFTPEQALTRLAHKAIDGEVL